MKGKKALEFYEILRESHWGCTSLKCNWSDGPCKYILSDVELAKRLGTLNWRRKGEIMSDGVCEHNITTVNFCVECYKKSRGIKSPVKCSLRKERDEANHAYQAQSQRLHDLESQLATQTERVRQAEALLRSAHRWLPDNLMTLSGEPNTKDRICDFLNQKESK